MRYRSIKYYYYYSVLLLLLLFLLLLLLSLKEAFLRNGNYTIYKHEEKKQLNYIQYENMSPIL